MQLPINILFIFVFSWTAFAFITPRWWRGPANKTLLRYKSLCTRPCEATRRCRFSPNRKCLECWVPFWPHSSQILSIRPFIFCAITWTAIELPRSWANLPDVLSLRLRTRIDDIGTVFCCSKMAVTRRRSKLWWSTAHQSKALLRSFFLQYQNVI